MAEDQKSSYALYNRIGLFLGPLLSIAVLLAPTPEGMTPEGHRCGAVAILMAVWWLTEALPLAATALLPIALFPLLGVIGSREVTSAYGDRNIFLFAGGFFIAMAIQKWNLHERIALNIVYRVGTRLSRLVLGFMIASAFLSMWISNTATSLMMLPIAIAVIDQLEKRLGAAKTQSFNICLLLGIAYACSIGGVATLIGTPPNIVFIAQYEGLFPEAPTIGFLQWMMIGVPFMVVFLAIVWLLLTKVLFTCPDTADTGIGAEIERRLRSLGRPSRGEWVVSIVATCTGLAWVFRSDIQIGDFVIPGWGDLTFVPAFVDDSTVAIFAAALLFVIPVDWKRGEFALDWDWAKRIPWGILILFGGGLALARAFSDSELVLWLGTKLTLLEGLPGVAVVFCVAIALTFLTELTSNTATTSVMLPILGGAAAPALGLNPLLVMIPATISASCAFMMPVATPPNAVVFGSDRLTIPQMARAGIFLNLIGTLLVTALVYFVALPVFGIDPNVVPDWAAP